MDAAIVIALIGAIVTMVGWVANNVLSSISERRREKLNFQIEHTRQQLQKLYGPLAFLMFEGRQSYEELFIVLGRKYVFRTDDDELSEPERETWLFWAEHVFLPHNERIKSLMAKNVHLIEGPQLPKSWLAFLDHANSWQLHHERYLSSGKSYSLRSRINWPATFEDEVISTFAMLKERYADLLGQRVQ